ncbi:uncharacterized protein [Palaemon carinicauda]|uniref:uncharacterized protein isoform X1 n=1 Tax=Palaemon carinicauda TaxID=392227 RepID=UPI0035B5D25B
MFNTGVFELEKKGIKNRLNDKMPTVKTDLEKSQNKTTRKRCKILQKLLKLINKHLNDHTDRCTEAWTKNSTHTNRKMFYKEAFIQLKLGVFETGKEGNYKQAER